MSKTVEQYKKKPVIVEAAQYTEYGKLVKGMCNSVSCFNSGNNTPHVHTIHDNQIVTLEVGDYILPCPDGEHFYPVKPDIFHSTYEPVTTPSPDVAGSDAVAFAEWMLDRYVHARNHPSFETQLWNPMHDKRPFGARAEFTTSQLYAKFREEHPQPAGASVEDELRRVIELNRDTAATLKKMVDSLAAFQPAPGIPAVKELVEAVNEVIESMFWQYKARNGKMMSVESGGEKCWIVPYEKMEILQTALAGFKGGMKWRRNH